MADMSEHRAMDSEHFSPYRSDGKLYGFICVVAGAMQPVGRAIVHELAAHGAACIYACSPLTSSPATTTNLPSDSDESLLTSINASFPNTKIIPYPYNLALEQDTLSLIDDILNTWGRLDIWISSTGLLGPPSITSTSPVDLLVAFENNALPAFLALKYAPAAMQKTSPRGTYPNAVPKDAAYGSIVVVTSVAGTYGGCWAPAFTIASHAALGVVRSGVLVLKGTGVRINAITAGQIDVGLDLSSSPITSTQSTSSPSAQFPPSYFQSERVRKDTIGLERAGRPEEVAKAVGFLASGFSSYITGAEIRVDGGAGVMNPITVPM